MAFVSQEEIKQRHALTERIQHALAASDMAVENATFDAIVNECVRWQRDSEELAELQEYVQRYQEKFSIRCGGSLKEKLVHALNEYEAIASKALSNAKLTTDDTVTWMRSIALVLEMVGNASTHSEKNARLRGCIELTESAIERLRKIEFTFHYNRYDSPDLFGSDYPVRHAMSKLHEAEYTIKDLQAQIDRLTNPEAQKPKEQIEEQPF